MENKRSPKNNSQRNAREEKQYYEQQREAQLIEDILNEFRNYDIGEPSQSTKLDLDSYEPEYGFDMPDYVKALFSNNTKSFEEKAVPAEDDFELDPKIFEPEEEDIQSEEFEVEIDFNTGSEQENTDFFAEIFTESSQFDEDNGEPTTSDSVSVSEEEVTVDEAEDEIPDISPIIEESAGVDVITEDHSEDDTTENHSENEDDNSDIDINVNVDSSNEDDDFYSTRELRSEFFTVEFDKKFREMFSGSLDDENKKLGGRKMRSAMVTFGEPTESARPAEPDKRTAEAGKAPVKTKKKGRTLWSVMLVLFIGVFVFSGYQFLNTFLTQRNEKMALEGLANVVTMTENGDAGTVQVNGTEFDTDWEDNNSEVLLKYQPLASMNEDMVGWLKIPDTVIDYPVMYTPDDGEYYLKRDFFGKKAKSGMIFVDENCDIEDGDNQIIYGHNMKNDTMFGTLDRYSQKEFWEEHQYIHYDSLYEERVYQVVGAFKARILNKDEEGFRYYRFYGSETEEEFNEYAEYLEDAALYDTGVDISYGDELITLSTCAYFTEDGRFVVVAKRIS